ncbi:hypothetical protein PNEG_01033 [Pneumocystis murina B123]|uniref:UPF3 domain-containing protein n=1 Tax=Pneumocystis murina (strain B123) TaxID=1069680 RepID=M7NUV3_PNEMU|nr:hypothetical protein PNEG_01033 [Pneumocystis murina B123]EMR10886.1 hypothetical protein PNEG_01033 [Pneumocystis murina B123]
MEKKTANNRENIHPRHPQQSTRLKVVVRYLPCNLSEQEFKNSVKEWISEEIEWFSFFPGKISTNRSKNDRHGRAYIKFKSPEALITFYKGINKHLFTDEKNKEQRVFVEFAPFQKIPRVEKQKHDIRQGTIDEDPEFITFQETLKNPNKDLQGQEQGKQEDDDTVPINAITPLIVHLRIQKKAAALKSKQQKKYILEKKASAQMKADSITAQIKLHGGFGSMKKYNKNKSKFQKEPNNSDARKESSMRPEELFPKHSSPHKRTHKNTIKKESSVTMNTIKILKPSNREKHSNSDISNKEKTYDSSQISKKNDTRANSTNKSENEPKKNTKKYHNYTIQSTQKEQKSNTESFNKSNTSFRKKECDHHSMRSFKNKNMEQFIVYRRTFCHRNRSLRCFRNIFILNFIDKFNS